MPDELPAAFVVALPRTATRRLFVWLVLLLPASRIGSTEIVDRWIGVLALIPLVLIPIREAWLRLEPPKLRVDQAGFRYTEAWIVRKRKWSEVKDFRLVQYGKAEYIGYDDLVRRTRLWPLLNRKMVNADGTLPATWKTTEPRDIIGLLNRQRALHSWGG